MESHWAAFDGLRAILALSVLGIHIPEFDFNIPIKDAIKHVIYPVPVFIIFSGFSCGRGYANKNWDAQNVFKFYKKRLKRIVPVYLLSYSISLYFKHVTDVSRIDLFIITKELVLKPIIILNKNTIISNLFISE